MISLLKFSKVHKSIRNVGGVTVLHLCTLPTMLYICTNFQKSISKGFIVIKQSQFPSLNFQSGIILQICWRNNGHCSLLIA